MMWQVGNGRNVSLKNNVPDPPLSSNELPTFKLQRCGLSRAVMKKRLDWTAVRATLILSRRGIALY
jgi:hypothetical protein